MRSDEVMAQVEIKPAANLDDLPLADLEGMVEAGAEVLEVYRILAKTSDNVVGELLRGHGTFYEWDHYPPGDVYDRETHGQYYFHAHPVDQRFPGEHGHVHTFLRGKGMPAGLSPAPLPDGKATKKKDDDPLCHLVAVAMDNRGMAFRLFTVNRWVTGETWYSAPDVAAMLEYFKIDQARPSWPTNRWLSALIQLYRPQIRTLLAARDRTVADWARRFPDRDVYEDRDLEVTSFVEISVEDQVRQVEQTLIERK